MFGLIDLVTREACIFCVLEDLTKDNLLLIVKENVNTNDNEEEVNESENTKTLLYSDCFRIFQILLK